MIVYGSLRGLEGRLQERVCLTREDKNYPNLHTVNRRLIGEHLALNEVFLRTGIHHGSQGVGNEFWI